MIFVDGKVVRHEALSIAPADDCIAAGRDHALDAEAEGGMMDIESSDDVGLVGNAGRSYIGVVNCGEMDDRVGTGHRFHDLAKVLNIAGKVFGGAAFGAGHAVEHGDFMSGVIKQFAYDPLADFADPTGDENLHDADLPHS